MIMTYRFRKVALTAHVTVSVGWLGAAAAYLALAVVGLISRDNEMARAADRVMEVIGWTVIVPFCLAIPAERVAAAWVPSGACSDHRIVAKFAPTVPATAVLLMHIPSVSRMARLAVDMAFATGDFAELRIQLVVHAVGGLLVLLTITALSVYKPGAGSAAEGEGQEG